VLHAVNGGGCFEHSRIPPHRNAAGVGQSLRLLKAAEIAGRLVVLSDGGPIGQVQDLVIDLGSGRVETIVVELLAGPGDTPPKRLRLVRWRSAVWSSGGSLRLDASGDAVRALTAVGDEDLRDFGGPASREALAAADRLSSTARPRRAGPTSPGWEQDGELVASVLAGPRALVEGTVDRYERVGIPEVGARAMVMHVSTARGPRVLVLGPATFVDGFVPLPKAGERVRVEARIGVVAGVEVFFAGTLRPEASPTVAIWDGDSPGWRVP